jgi:hypothetical protein
VDLTYLFPCVHWVGVQCAHFVETTEQWLCFTALPAAVDVGIQRNSTENVATLVLLHPFV